MPQKLHTGGVGVGVFCAIAAFVLWGAFPIFWKELSSITPTVITAHRIVWSTLSLLIIIFIRGRQKLLLDKIKQPKVILYSGISGILLITNWLIYVWGTNNNRVVEISMGYYILPIFIILLGCFVLKERLNRLQACAVGIAAAGVTLQGLGLGALPWPALGVAGSFGVYSLIKKLTQSDGFTALIIELGLLSPFALFYLYQQSSHTSIWGDGSAVTLCFISFTGLVTIAPLLFFTAATNRIPLTTIGMLQFIAPTGQFLLGVFYFKESLNQMQLISFSLIWIAVIVYAYSKLKTEQEEQ